VTVIVTNTGRSAATIGIEEFCTPNLGIVRDTVTVYQDRGRFCLMPLIQRTFAGGAADTLVRVLDVSVFVPPGTATGRYAVTALLGADGPAATGGKEYTVDAGTVTLPQAARVAGPRLVRRVTRGLVAGVFQVRPAILPSPPVSCHLAPLC
jgi:hypothetical protein